MIFLRLKKSVSGVKLKITKLLETKIEKNLYSNTHKAKEIAGSSDDKYIEYKSE